MLRVRDRLGLIVAHLGCAIRGHKWDSDRPSGPLGFERGDLCWRCNKCRPYPTVAAFGIPTESYGQATEGMVNQLEAMQKEENDVNRDSDRD